MRASSLLSFNGTEMRTSTVPIEVDGYWSTVTLLNEDDGVFVCKTISPSSLLLMNATLQLVKEFAKGTKVTLSFTQHGGSVDLPNNDDGGLTSYFSSYGPNNDLLFKPAISHNKTPRGVRALAHDRRITIRGWEELPRSLAELMEKSVFIPFITRVQFAASWT